MRVINLTQGKSAKVDDVDFDFLSQWKWSARQDHDRVDRWYAVRTQGDQMILMHRLILEPGELQVDHKNGDGLDNQRLNLRIATPTQNMQNRPGWGGSSLFKGVYWSTHDQKWVMQIWVNKKCVKRRHLHEMDAALQYDEFAKAHFGEFAYLNFPVGSILTYLRVGRRQAKA